MKLRSPTDAVTPETEIANIMGDDGLPIITHWYEPATDFYNEDKSRTRNRAGADTWLRVESGVTSNPSKHIFTTMNGANAVENHLSFFDTDINLDEYTVFAVAKVADTFATGTTAIIGTTDTSSVVNAPYLLYNAVTSSWEVYGQHTNQDKQITHPMTATNARKTHLYTLTRSQSNGVTLSVDGIKVAETVSAKAKAKNTAKKSRVMGFNFSSGAFSGVIGNLIICKKDISQEEFELDKIESYLMSKYSITTP